MIHPGLFRNGPWPLKVIDILFQIIFVAMMLSLICRIPYFKLCSPFVAAFLITGACRYQKKYATEKIEKYVLHPGRNISDSIMSSPVMEPIRSSVFRQKSEPEEELSTESFEFEPSSDNAFQSESESIETISPKPRLPRPKSGTSLKTSESESEVTTFSIQFVFILYLAVISWENPDVLAAESLILATLVIWWAAKVVFLSILTLFNDQIEHGRNNFLIFVKNRRQLTSPIIFTFQSFVEADLLLSSAIVSWSSELAVIFTICASIFSFCCFIIYMGEYQTQYIQYIQCIYLKEFKFITKWVKQLTLLVT